MRSLHNDDWGLWSSQERLKIIALPDVRGAFEISTCIHLHTDLPVDVVPSFDHPTLRRVERPTSASMDLRAPTLTCQVTGVPRRQWPKIKACAGASGWPEVRQRLPKL
jgi:hypothetical protein